MERNLVVASPEMSIADLAMLLQTKQVSGAPVVDADIPPLLPLP